VAQIVKTFASGTEGMGFKSWSDQISHTLSTTRHRCNLWSVGPGVKSQRWAPLTPGTRYREASITKIWFF